LIKLLANRHTKGVDQATQPMPATGAARLTAAALSSCQSGTVSKTVRATLAAAWKPPKLNTKTSYQSIQNLAALIAPLATASQTSHQFRHDPLSNYGQNRDCHPESRFPRLKLAPAVNVKRSKTVLDTSIIDKRGWRQPLFVIEPREHRTREQGRWKGLCSMPLFLFSSCCHFFSGLCYYLILRIKDFAMAIKTLMRFYIYGEKR